ncbi:hut operon transcriptional regulator HutP [Priestia taiwanensis]|uniref:Hut operon positive regulatory protein n=1 Tax=Priestia taiwanensis TaxID=1347902 RepID=A0A917ELY2_9BACI|nr:hut operon transcriptional regulator HutP [Priestia taiwanensis]MBM7362027.1 hut operon positive regulator [Priestia taiwanensis]GGE58872.1 Hut operon positive regulatory protein [Priestia taiwanensis]
MDNRIGRLAMLLLLEEGERPLPEGWSYCIGKVGAMDEQKVVAAIETAARSNHIIRSNVYRETHALYHAIMEALHGVTRGHFQLGDVLRTVGLRFAIVRGTPYKEASEGEWIAVALYGTIGAPVKGLEHETMGLGINHI